MIRHLVLLFLTAFLLSPEMLPAREAVEKPLPVDGHIAPNGRKVELSWFTATPPRVGAVTVKRRRHGQIGGASWETISPALGPVMRFTDETVSPGIAYEYQVLRSARDIVDAGYWLTGVEIPAIEARGNAYLVVDETVAPEIARRLARFERDLTGDGWQVLRHDVPRWDGTVSLATLEAALSIKNWLQDQYLSDPFGQHAVILVGHLPIVTSGQANPDGHAPAPLETDLFYVEMDARWRASTEGRLLENQLPSDAIEMQIGRIDFANVSANDRAREVRMLQSYFDKNHHWRMGMIGDLREAYGNSSYLLSERYTLRNIVGAELLRTGGHRDTGKVQPWLWGVDFGHYDGRTYLEDDAIKAVFAINFGSGKQRIGAIFNPMSAMLAQPWYTVAVGWGGRPAWWLHHMALGGTIGDVHMRTVNNGVAREPYRESMDYYPTGGYIWRNPVWVNLLGDPTLRAFPLAPPSEVHAARTDRGVTLSWSASPDSDTIGYKIYRASQGSMNFMPLNDGAVLQELEFTDTDPEENARYMIRGYGLKDVHAGSFYTFSQGAFADTDVRSAFVTELEITTAPGEPVDLSKALAPVQDAKAYAFVEEPKIGQLRQDDMGWQYTPPAGFTGTVSLRFSGSDALRTREGRLTITIRD